VETDPLGRQAIAVHAPLALHPLLTLSPALLAPEGLFLTSTAAKNAQLVHFRRIQTFRVKPFVTDSIFILAFLPWQ